MGVTRVLRGGSAEKIADRRGGMDRPCSAKRPNARQGCPWSAKTRNACPGSHLPHRATIPRTMRTLIVPLIARLRAALMSRTVLALENAALRQQLAVYRSDACART
jgi:hypothetical protein